MFPWDDPARRIIAVNHEFDPGCLDINLNDNVDGHDAQYLYWGARLQILARVLDDQTRRQSMTAWLKERSLLELATLATLVLGALAILVGISSVVVDAWKIQGNDN